MQASGIRLIMTTEISDKMKKVTFILGIFVFLWLGTSAQSVRSKTGTVCFKSSMHCAGCENTIFELLRFEKGVKDLKVDHVSNTIKVVFDNKKTTPETLSKAIVKKGYKADAITEKEYDQLIKPAASPEVKSR